MPVRLEIKKMIFPTLFSFIVWDFRRENVGSFFSMKISSTEFIETKLKNKESVFEKLLYNAMFFYFIENNSLS